MKFSFREKVQFERRILGKVNGSRVWSSNLFGLTDAAITQWASAIRLENHHPLLSSLRELKERCRLESDKSRDVFENNDLVDKKTIEQAWDALSNALDSYSMR